MRGLPSRGVINPKEFGRVALLVGGESAEREVSLNGGQDVGDALARLGVLHECFDGAEALFDAIGERRVDRVFNLMHGPGGEDGAIQGALELMKIPCTGTGVLGSALTMDKVRSKWVWERLGIPTTPFRVLESGDDDLDRVTDGFVWPVFVKPTGLGSSIGISKVDGPEGMAEAVNLARRYGDTVVVEQGVSGGEYFVGVLGDETLPMIRIETPRAFYDYEAKYQSDETRYFCPCGLPEADEARLSEMAMNAFHALQAEGWGRVDFILDDEGQPWFLEVNTVPGMTDHSLVPQAAAVMGVGFDELVWRILETSL